MLKMFQSKSKIGFTLIELLVVIAIIGVLASIVLASLNNARRKSRDARRITDVRQIQLALELYFDANLGNDGAGANVGLSYPRNGATPLSVLQPQFIAAVPTDPSTAALYTYRAVDSGPPAVGAECAAADTTPCLYYHIGADLEEDNTSATGGGNPSLNSDRDLDSSGYAGFAGLTLACTGAAGTIDGCYDITP